MKRYLVFLLVAGLSVIFTGNGYGQTFEAKYQPWSGYWWPFSRGSIVTGSHYKGKPSPLSKFDQVVKGTYYGNAYYYGLQYFYDPDALDWEGLCFSWAVASMLEDEPEYPGVYNDVTFYVGDKKALLTAAYHRPLYNTYPVSRPEDFHKILGQFIRDEKTPIIIDLHTDGEVWNYPVFKYEFFYSDENSNGRTIRHYTTTIYYPRNSVKPDYVGTGVTSSTYEYFFEIDSSGDIVRTGWEGSSFYDYPIRAYEPFSHGSQNPNLDYDIVKQIVSTHDDDHEENNTIDTAAPLSSGTYPLIAMDMDFFQVTLSQGDTLDVRIDMLDGEIRNFNVYSPSGKLFKEIEVPGDFELSGNLPGSYVFEVKPAEPYVSYELSLEHQLTHQAILPVKKGGFHLNGLALVNPDNSAMGRTIVSVVDQEGILQKSVATSESLHHLVGLLENMFSSSLPDNGYIRIDSDLPVKGLEVLFDRNIQMSGTNIIPREFATDKIIFPYLEPELLFSIRIGLINLASQEEIILAESFDSNGDLLVEDMFELGPGEKIENGFVSLRKSGMTGMSFSTQSGRNTLVGYLIIEQDSWGSTGEAVIGLPYRGYREIVVPHVACNSMWRTILAVINEGPQETVVDCRAFDADGKEIGSVQPVLRSNQALVSEFSQLFPNIACENVAAMKMTSLSGQLLRGYMLYELENGDQLAGITLHSAFPSPIFLPHLAGGLSWWTGIGVMNAGNIPSDVTFSLFNENGLLLKKTTRTLNVNQRLGAALDVLFSGQTGGRYVRIESEYSGHPISGVYIIGSSNQITMMGDAIQ